MRCTVCRHGVHVFGFQQPKLKSNRYRQGKDMWSLTGIRSAVVPMVVNTNLVITDILEKMQEYRVIPSIYHLASQD